MKNFEAVHFSSDDWYPVDEKLDPYCLFVNYAIWQQGKQPLYNISANNKRGGRECMTMKRKFNPFRFKAIETRYDGYHFRSRTEARWAMFFNTLGIKYEYEKEGYSLEGIAYLPDFWIPQQDCFIEIKGQEPTEEELHKAKLLCLYTGKEVYIFCGEIGLSREGASQSYSYTPPRQWKYLSTGSLGDSSTQRMVVPTDLLVLRQKLHDCYIDLRLSEDGNPILCAQDLDWGIDEISDYLQTIQDQQNALKYLQSIFPERTQDFLSMLSPGEGWDYDFFEMNDELKGQRWTACSNCGSLDIGYGTTEKHRCENGDLGIFNYKHPRILAAYKTAKEARF